MKRFRHIVPLLIGVMAMQACSSKPRNFEPVFKAAPADQASYEAAHYSCRMQIKGQPNGMDRLASGGAGAAAGAAAGVAGTAVAGSTTTFVGSMAAAGATIIAMPVAAVIGAWSLAKSKKRKKERAIQTATAECLAQAGYQVVGWERVNRRTSEK